MSRSYAAHSTPHADAEASTSTSASASSNNGRSQSATVDDSFSDAEDSLLADDPLEGSFTDTISFKRKQKAPPSSGPASAFARFLSSPLRSQSPSRPRSRQSPNTLNNGSVLTYLDGPGDGGAAATDGSSDTKDSSAADWSADGPGRRVGYDDLTAIDWIFEYAKERQRLKALRAGAAHHGVLGQLRYLADEFQIWWVLVATGVASGAIAAFIDVASDWLGDLKTGHCSNVEGDGKFYLNKVFCCWGYEEMAQCADWHSWGDALGIHSKGGSWIVQFIFFVIFSVIFASTASFLVEKYAPYSKHSGIPEIKTILGGFVIRRFMGTWTLIIKSLGLCLAVASGLWLGKEGPLVHVACCCASLFMRMADGIKHNEARKREVLSAAAAAGISVAFGSPIGGVLFSLEQLSYYFPDKTMWQSFVCAMVGAVTLQAFNPFRTGKLVLYTVVYHSGWHGFELLPFAILGILGGLYGGLFIKLNMRIAKWRENNAALFRSPVLEVTVVAFLTALVNFPITFMRAQATELVYVLFAECRDIADDQLGLCKSGKANTGVVALLLVSAFLGFLLSALTFGLQIPAGIILPSLAVGALYGRAVGLIVKVWQEAHPTWLPFGACEPDIQCVTPGTYAIIGAASALAGVTRMTVSLVVIMFELTGALTYVLPIMIAVMLAKWVGDAISPRGIYESWIALKGYPFLDNRDDDAAAVPDVPVSAVMTRYEDLVCLPATGHTVGSLRALLDRYPFRGFPVIEHDRSSAAAAILLGYISRTELAFALDAALAPPRRLGPDADAFFADPSLSSSSSFSPSIVIDPSASLDLRPWMDRTPITLSVRAGLQLCVSMFRKLGLRYVLFTDRGVLRGLLTKKDVWAVVEAGELWGRQEEAERCSGLGVEGRGLLDGREEEVEDEEGLDDDGVYVADEGVADLGAEGERGRAG